MLPPRYTVFSAVISRKINICQKKKNLSQNSNQPQYLETDIKRFAFSITRNIELLKTTILCQRRPAYNNIVGERFIGSLQRYRYHLPIHAFPTVVLPPRFFCTQYYYRRVLPVENISFYCGQVTIGVYDGV